MKRNFTNENFERFLQQSADSLRMKPSADVWKGISKHLSQRKRRIGAVLIISLLFTTALGYYLVENSQKLTANSVNSSSAKTKNESSKTTTQSSYNKNAEPLASSEQTAVAAHQTVVAQNSIHIPERSSENNGISNLNTPAATEFTPSVNAVLSGNSLNETSILKSSTDNSLQEQSTAKTVSKIITSKKKLGFQFFFTPTISYRHLNGNKAYNGPYPAVYSNVNDIVTNKPNMGFEVGFTAKYTIAKNVKLRGGLQFNISQYDIKTFSSTTQLATIALRDGSMYSAITNYNNISGYQSDWIHNFYFGVSAPVGAELKIKGDDKVQFGVAGTIQPTYILGNRSYLLSTDYKNYAEAPSLVRHWNVSTGLETFVSYSTGHLNWQVGPQVRYQLLSSYVKTYPVKENLFDYGLKVGISLNK